MINFNFFLFILIDYFVQIILTGDGHLVDRKLKNKVIMKRQKIFVLIYILVHNNIFRIRQSKNINKI